MESKWSPSWNRSIQPRKQRKFRYNAPLHARRKFVSVHLSKELKERHETRAVPVRVGDEVKIVRGTKRGTRGAVEKVILSTGKIYISDVKVKKVDGSEVLKPFQPSNLIITKLGIDDKRRQMMFDRKKTTKPKTEKPKVEKPKVEKKAEKKEVKAKPAK